MCWLEVEEGKRLWNFDTGEELEAHHLVIAANLGIPCCHFTAFFTRGGIFWSLSCAQSIRKQVWDTIHDLIGTPTSRSEGCLCIRSVPAGQRVSRLGTAQQIGQILSIQKLILFPFGCIFAALWDEVC
jgi:hypothetical protein